MNATKISISLDATSLQLLDQIQKTYRCSNRSQAVARAVLLFKELSEQQALESAYTLSRQQDLEMNGHFIHTVQDGTSNETW